MAIENKAPGKDVSEEDLQSKFPLAAKKSPDHKSLVTVGDVTFGGDFIPVFAGPNMVEDEAMIVQTAREVKARGASFLRGGAFKPLTFPYRSPKYTETREDGVAWLKKAKEETGILVITEVMEERYLDLICETADMLQIGSRNMQNYPLITAAAKTGKPMMIKRHFGCSLRDWLGAAEYALIEGNSNVVLCERGVAAPHTHRGSSRFLLDLQAVPAAQEVTHLPVVVDPSHATFWAPWVAPMSLASVACGADGIMLEVHPDPPNSAVDPLQPIGFEPFGDLMKQMDATAKVIGRRVL
ncbi:3-deoxy-7-phosphoheptulonate synthase [Magnetofaba australis]|uniref:Putative 3-deoxy-D-arabinoheptulosonate-7-phosphate synthase n=1 Tax=Magnetofaba australis IT-1 TaxID=1434232 RepID=A0A1Y2K1T8_9PROT|nr:3-deoxy-7-phosphoheptulonate synthase [Magnetofaba australis]OSM00162.1 putative 3-deoxy-D-arabinoheptulosonate-7-phosphate synthase [Magnetofaba australis IT-1]